MKDTQKRFLGAVLAASSVAGIVAPSVTAMATVVEDENKATAEDLKAVIAEYTTKLEADAIFANYHRVQYAAERLAQYDANASQEALANISKYADKVFTEEVKTIVDKMDGFAASKSMASYDELVTKDIQAMTNKENAEYLMGRLDVWGKAIVFEVDPNYVKATDAIMEVANLVSAGKYDAAEKQVVVAKDAIKAIKTYEVNGAYLEGKLKIEEDKLAEKANLKVVSAEAINAKEVKVVFNKEVDEDSAENMNNYTVYVGNDNEKLQLGDFADEGSLQDDNKTVILQIKDAKVLKNGQSHKVEVKNVFDIKGKKLETYKGDFVVFNDKTAPSLLSTEYTGSTVKFTFDEPLKDVQNMNVKIDNQNVTVKADDFSKDAGKYELTVDLKKGSKPQDLGKHTVKISNATDYADNIADMITTQYTATEENEKPVVKSVEDEAERKVKVTFNTKVEGLVNDNFEIKKGNHTFSNISVGDINEDNEVIVTIKEDVNQNKLYEDDEKSVDLSVKVKDYAGTNGKVGDDFTGKVTLEKDETAPTVKAAELNRIEDKDSKELIVFFNEDLDTTVDSTRITVIKDGVKQTVEKVNTRVDGDNAKKLIIKLADKITTGEYKITLEKGAVKDEAGNKNEALSTTLTYSDDDGIAIQPKSMDVSQEVENNIIKVVYKEEMTDSALDLSNYKVNGVKLSSEQYAGTTASFVKDDTEHVTADDKQVVEIKLAKGNFDGGAEKQDGTVILSNDIKAKSGNYLAKSDTDDSEYKQTITGKFADDTNPEIDTVEFVKNKSNDTTTRTLKVTFKEDVTIKDADKVVKDFKVKQGSTDKDVKLVTAVTENPDTLIITLKQDVNINSSNVTIKVTEDISDNDGETSVTDKSDLENRLEATEAQTIRDSVVEPGVIVDTTEPSAPTIVLVKGDVAGQVKLTGTEDTMEYKLNDEEWKACTKDMSLVANIGDKIQLKVKANGNKPESKISTYTVKAENIGEASAPVVTLASGSKDKVKLVGIKKDTMEYKLNDEEWKACTQDDMELIAIKDNVIKVRVKATAQQPESKEVVLTVEDSHIGA